MAPSSPEPVVQRLADLDRRTRRRLVARSVLVSVACVAALVTAYYLVPWDGAGVTSIVVRTAVSLGVLVAVTVLAVPYVIRSPFPVLRALEAIAVVVGLAVVSFASIYLIMSINQPAAFTEPLGRTDALYFSMTTSTTIGYGDISATSEAARIVVMLHMVTNVVVIGVAVRVLGRTARRRIES